MGWGEEEDMFESDEEETDLGEESPTEPVNVSQKSNVGPLVSSRNVSQSNVQPKKNGRRVKVKPMPLSITTKWPDVVTMLLTTQSGKQVLFVKG